MLARIRKSIKEKDAGFTLVELLVVMIIIGILAAIAIPVFLNQRKKAVDTSIKSDLRSVAQSVETSFVDAQTYPTAATWTAAGTGGKTAGTVITDARVTGSNTIQYRAVTDGYCLRGFGDNANATGTSSFFFYDSKAGGLVTGSPTATSTNCPAT